MFDFVNVVTLGSTGFSLYRDELSGRLRSLYVYNCTRVFPFVMSCHYHCVESLTLVFKRILGLINKPAAVEKERLEVCSQLIRMRMPRSADF